MSDDHVDAVILGTGPAGFQAGIHAARAKAVGEGCTAGLAAAKHARRQRA